MGIWLIITIFLLGIFPFFMLCYLYYKDKPEDFNKDLKKLKEKITEKRLSIYKKLKNTTFKLFKIVVFLIIIILKIIYIITNELTKLTK